MHHPLLSFFKTIALLLVSVTCALAAPSPIQERADRFLALANAGYKGLYRVLNEAQWLAVTDVTPVHDAASEAAGKAAAAFNGNPALINEARELLTHRAELTELTVRQLNQLLLNAAEGPMTNPALVAARVEAETKQASTLNSFEFRLDGKPITANQIDDALDKSVNLEERRRVWEASKESGKALKPGLIKLRDLRNGCAKELGHHDYFALQVAAYGMTTEEMVKLHDDFLKELRPLYLQLHTWTKYKLAEKYHQPVPKRIPAHWINNRWSQEWGGLVEAANIDDRFKDRTPEWIIKTAEEF
jgi:peptidyl-dipeptidase A